MPELPEVEHVRRVLERIAVGHTITRAEAARDHIVFEDRSPQWVTKRLRHRRVQAAHRHGKYAWLELDEGPSVILHLGMTGTVRYPGDRPLLLASSPAEEDQSWPPRFTKLVMTFDDDVEVAVTNARRLGRILFRDDPRAEDPIGKLGFDALTELPTVSDFAALLERRGRAVVKSLLLDQSFAAGVGNWIADEVLYQARIDPRRPVASLTEDEAKRMRRAIGHITTKAVEADARKDALPRTWLFHRRWGRKPNARTARGEKIEHLVIGGRSTAWVPTRQT
jgi:formamidopyrimidine-DNA glycosylase